MFVSKDLAVNQKGHLTIGGVDTVDLAKEYGTPLYVMDEDYIRQNMALFRDSIDKYYGGNGLGLLRFQGLRLQGNVPDCQG